MSTTQSPNPPVSPVQGLVNAAWPYIGGRRGLIILAIVIGAAGAALNWGWLVAVGAAPILLAILPCAAMCGLGMCMKKGKGKSCCSPGDKTPAKGSDLRKGPDGSA